MRYRGVTYTHNDMLAPLNYQPRGCADDASGDAPGCGHCVQDDQNAFEEQYFRGVEELPRWGGPLDDASDDADNDTDWAPDFLRSSYAIPKASDDANWASLTRHLNKHSDPFRWTNACPPDLVTFRSRL